MQTDNSLIKDHWYGARYSFGFTIIFKVEEASPSLILYRKDGIIIDTLPEGYLDIVAYGEIEPDYR